MADTFDVRYRKVLALVRNPTSDNWYERYDCGLRLERVEQGRRFVAETPVLPEIKFMGDMQNERFRDAYTAFIAGKGSRIRLAPAWSDPSWAGSPMQS
jgi:hypothetical protein